MDVELTKVKVETIERQIKPFTIHKRGITIVRIGSTPYEEMEAWLVENGAIAVLHPVYTFSTLYKVSEDIKLLFALRWA